MFVRGPEKKGLPPASFQQEYGMDPPVKMRSSASSPDLRSFAPPNPYSPLLLRPARQASPLTPTAPTTYATYGNFSGAHSHEEAHPPHLRASPIGTRHNLGLSLDTHTVPSSPSVSRGAHSPAQNHHEHQQGTPTSASTEPLGPLELQARLQARSSSSLKLRPPVCPDTLYLPQGITSPPPVYEKNPLLILGP
jgi:hypothetical protein